MSAFTNALDLHFTTLLAQAGQLVQYSNGTVTKEVTAIKTVPKVRQIDIADGIVLDSRNWDWLIRPSDLGFEPKLGHMITDVGGTEYKVQPSNANDVAFVPSDGNKTFLRIFTEEQ